MAAVESIESLRLLLASLIRSRVVGDDPDDRMVAVMLAPGDRWFADDRPIRRVHADASMFVGGLRALLLQSLHPLAMAGVAQHSDYRTDPWGRLQRTADYLAVTTFGPAVDAELVVARVRAVHERVKGTARDGRSYSAGDPHLLRWVHICEVDSFLAAHRVYGAEPLTRAEADAYVADMAIVAERLGVNHAPRTVSELRAEFREYRPELRGTPEAREAARFLLVDPPLPLVARGPYAVLGAAAVALLPMWARWPLRLPYLPVTERLVARPAGDALTRLIRWSLSPVA
jgi:uncharacterized protein (DUF2236 family)